MFNKNKLAIFFCVACSIFWIPQVYHQTKRYLAKEVRIHIQEYTSNYDFPDIYLCVFIDNTNLNISEKIPTNGLKNPDYINFISNLTIGEIREMLRPELFSLKVRVESPFSYPNSSIPTCQIVHYIDGFEIFIKITCSSLENYYASILTIEHNVPSYSVLLTENNTFDGIYHPQRNVIPSMSSGHEQMMISVTKHTKVVHSPPKGPGCSNYTQDIYNGCKINAARKLLDRALDVNTIVPLNESIFDDHRFVNYVTNETKKEGNISGCFDPFDQKTKCRHVQYDTISTVLASNTTQSKLSFMLDRTIDFTYDFEYAFPFQEYLLKVIEIVSIWLGFSVLSIISQITETFGKILSYVSSIMVPKLMNRVFPGMLL